MRDPQLLVLDEPTAVLPPGEIGALLDICRRVARSAARVILVTHKLAEIAKVADRVTVLRTGRLVADESMASTPTWARWSTPWSGRRRSTARRSGAWARDRRRARRARAGAPKPGFAALQYATASRCSDRHGVARLDNFTLVDPSRRDRRPRRRRGQRPERARHGARRPAGGRPKAASIIGGDRSHQPVAAAVTAAGVGIVPEDRHARGLRHRHVGRREHVS